MSAMTLAEFKTYVKRDFKWTNKDTEIAQAYNDMLKWLAVKLPIGDMKFRSYVTTSEGVYDYELPCSLLHMIHPIMLLDGTATGDGGYPLIQMTYQQYQIREPNPTRSDPNKGKPTHYTIFSRNVLLTPIPDRSTYVMEIWWGKRPTEQSIATDVPPLGAEYNEVLKWGTLERLYEGMQRYDEAGYWGAKYKDQKGDPIGSLKTLLDNEISVEGDAIGRVQANNL